MKQLWKNQTWNWGVDVGHLSDGGKQEGEARTTGVSRSQNLPGSRDMKNINEKKLQRGTADTVEEWGFWFEAFNMCLWDQQLFLLTVISHISDSVWYLCSLFVGYSSPHSNMPNDYRISEITPPNVLQTSGICVYFCRLRQYLVCVTVCECECVVFPCPSAVRGRKPTRWHVVKALMQFVAQGLLSGCHVLLPPPSISDPPVLHSLLCRRGRVVKTSQK